MLHIIIGQSPETPDSGEAASVYIYEPGLLTQNLKNMIKITYIQAEIESSKPVELQDCNEAPKVFAWTLNFAHLFAKLIGL